MDARSPIRSSPLGLTFVLAVGLLPFAGCRFAANGHNQEGVRLFQQGQANAAIQQFQQAIASDPKNADAYYNLATTMHRLGTQHSNRDWQTQAESFYLQCLNLDNNHVDCYRGLSVLLCETNRSDKAFTLLRDWAARSPTTADARIELARLYEEFGDKDTSKVHLTQAVQLNPNSHRAWAALGRLSEQSGDYTQALVNYQRSYQLNSFQPQVADRIASLSRSTPLAGGLPSGGTLAGGVISVTPPTPANTRPGVITAAPPANTTTR